MPQRGMHKLLGSWWRRQSSTDRTGRHHRRPLLGCLVLVTIAVTILSLRDLNNLVLDAAKKRPSVVEEKPLLTTFGWHAVAERVVEEARNSGKRKEVEETHVVRFQGAQELQRTEAIMERPLFGDMATKDQTQLSVVQTVLSTHPVDQMNGNATVHPENARPDRGPHVPFTSGLVGAESIYQDDVTQEMQSSPENNRKYHVVITAQGSAVHWQSRICYYWYLRRKESCEKLGPCDMGGFTRILHSGHEDDLMDEIPTFVAEELPDKHKKAGDRGYVVINRPYAFVQWVKQANITEKYVLMSEPDHLFLRPMPNLMKGESPAAFPFFYIAPSKLENAAIARKYLGPLTTKELESDVAPIGNAPTMLSFDTIKEVAPVWMNVSLQIFQDRDAQKEWGWVQEMYAFALAVYLIGVRDVRTVPNIMSQPPWDTELNITSNRPFYILHYTYGMDYTLEGKFTPGKYGEWRFDKRSYASMPPKRGLKPPPKGMNNGLVRLMITMFNEAMEKIPCWDEYSTTGRKTPCG